MKVANINKRLMATLEDGMPVLVTSAQSSYRGQTGKLRFAVNNLYIEPNNSKCHTYEEGTVAVQLDDSNKIIHLVASSVAPLCPRCTSSEETDMHTPYVSSNELGLSYGSVLTKPNIRKEDKYMYKPNEVRDDMLVVRCTIVSTSGVSCQYYDFLYPANNKTNIADALYCVCNTVNGYMLCKIHSVYTAAEYNTYKLNSQKMPFQFVVDVVDESAYKQTLETERKKVELLTKMDRRVAEVQQQVIYEQISTNDDEMKDLLKEYKALL